MWVWILRGRVNLTHKNGNTEKVISIFIPIEVIVQWPMFRLENPFLMPGLLQVDGASPRLCRRMIRYLVSRW